MIKMAALGSLAGLTGSRCAGRHSSADLAAGGTEGPIQTRALWTWDHRTEWAMNRPGAHMFPAPIARRWCWLADPLASLALADILGQG